MEGPHLSDSEYFKNGTDNLGQKGLDYHCGLSPTDGPRDEEGSSDWKWVGPGDWQAPCQEEKHELCLRKGLLCLFGTVYHRLSPGNHKAKMAAESHLAQRQAGCLAGRKPISQTEAVPGEEGKEQAGKLCVLCVCVVCVCVCMLYVCGMCAMCMYGECVLYVCDVYVHM